MSTFGIPIKIIQKRLFLQNLFRTKIGFVYIIVMNRRIRT